MEPAWIFEERKENVKYIGFNDDRSRITIGTNLGYRVFETDTMDLKLEWPYEGGIDIVEILDRTNILLIA